MNQKTIYPKQTTASAGRGRRISFLLAAVLLLGWSPEGATEECPLDLTIEGDVVTGERQVAARNSITARDYVVAQGAEVKLQAGAVIRLARGFTVEAGSLLTAENDPGVECNFDPRDNFDPRKNIIAQHDRSSKQYKKGCKDCHADIHIGTSLDPFISTAHRGMFPFAAGRPGSDKQCTWCHRTVDLSQGTQVKEKSLGNVRRHVDVRLCTLCHGPDRGPGEQFYQSGLSPTNPDGPLLYGLVCSGCHGPLENSKVRGESARDIRKKIDENEGGMGVLEVLSTEEIDALAAALQR
jgi:hypothetical protein